MDAAKIDRVAEILLDTFLRQGEVIELSQVERQFEKRDLDASEAAAVISSLSTIGVVITRPKEPGYHPSKPVAMPVRSSKKRAPQIEFDLTRQYLREIGKHRLLSAEDEVVLARRIRAGVEARSAIEKGENGRELSKVCADGDLAFEQMLVSNLRLVVSVVKKYGRAAQSMTFLDLVQEGYFGLVRAVEKFDHDLGYKFSTYATWWIRQAIDRGIANRDRLVRVPVYVHTEMMSVRRSENRLFGILGRPPTTLEVADELNEEPAKVDYLRALLYQRTPVSLDAPILSETEDGEELVDFLDFPIFSDPAEAVELRARSEAVATALSFLGERELLIVKMRLGLWDGEVHTLEEIGKKLGITRERVRQLEKMALEMLRQPSISDLLSDFAHDAKFTDSW